MILSIDALVRIICPYSETEKKTISNRMIKFEKSKNLEVDDSTYNKIERFFDIPKYLI